MWLDRETGLPAEDPGRGNRPMNWHERHWYPIVRERVEDLLPDARHGDVFLAGSVPNELDVWDLFTVVICLVVDDETLIHRLQTRTGNDFGKTAAVQDAVLGWNATSASDYERFGATLIDATQPLKDVVDEVLRAVAARGCEATGN